ncbi:MAG TPA: hypothetical protein VGE39_00290 [Prosthecobacter sp.]
MAFTRHKLPSFIDTRVERLYHISGVFSGRVTRWRCNYVEIRFAGSKSWQAFRTDLYSHVYPSGSRNRLDRMLDDSSGPHGAVLRRRMAQYLAQRHRQLFPRSAAVEEIRFVRTWFDAGSPALAFSGGAWSYPPLRLVPDKDRVVLSTHVLRVGDSQKPPARFDAPAKFGDAELLALLAKDNRWGAFDLAGTQVTRAAVAALTEKTPSLKALNLRHTACADAWGDNIAKLSRLESLNLGLSQVTSASGNWLPRLTALQSLLLDDTSVDNWLVSRLRDLPDLEHLSLARTKVNGDLIFDLSAWPDLRSLNLQGCQLRDRDLAKLKSATKLELLDLGLTSVGDGDVPFLRRAARLRELCLKGTRVTGASLPELKGLPSLQFLDLAETSVTLAAAEVMRGHPTLRRVVARDGTLLLQTPAVKGAPQSQSESKTKPLARRSPAATPRTGKSPPDKPAAQKYSPGSPAIPPTSAAPPVSTAGTQRTVLPMPASAPSTSPSLQSKSAPERATGGAPTTVSPSVPVPPAKTVAPSASRP